MKGNFDIAKNIKSIEKLKLQLLNRVSSLFNAFNDDETGEELIDDICNILITSYLLGEKLGYDYKKIDEEIIKKLKLEAIDKIKENDYNYTDLEKYLKVRCRE